MKIQFIYVLFQLAQTKGHTEIAKLLERKMLNQK